MTRAKTVAAAFLFVFPIASTLLRAQQARPLAVYLNADMEGVAGISATDDPDAKRFMTEEVNAAIAGAFAVGAQRVVVNDGHGGHNNLLMDRLDPRVVSFRGALKPYGMMEGLDSSFSAVVFQGSHAMAGSTGAFLAHTGSGAVEELKINGVAVGEPGMNALYAAWYGVPVVFISGDSGAVSQLKQLVPGTVGVPVKWGIWNRAARMLSPDSARAAIRRGVEQALRAPRPALPALRPPFRFELTYSSSTMADVAEGIPGVRRTGPATVTFETQTYPAGYRLFRVLYRHLQQ
ncbi:MAG: M55 family metallopeptidase [Gemmatimonadetes bacterium]|nr:M55 family metallopeptidase [Gemmatimonadota bacterium]